MLSELENPFDHLRAFITALVRALDAGATVSLEETKRALEEEKLQELLEALPQGNPLSGLPEKERAWIVEGLTNAGQLAEEMEPVSFRNGLLWLLDLAVEMLYHGEMP